MTTALTFQSTTFNAITHNSQPWLLGTEISHALGYSRGDRISEIYKRNASEFTEGMTCTRKLRVQDQHRDVRIFSLRGAHLLAMFARTPKAQEFRRWVLDILDRETAVPPAPTSAPAALTSLVDDPYLPYQEAKTWACKLGALHGRGALITLLAQFDARNLFGIPVHRLPEFIAVCQKVTAPPEVVPAPEPKRLTIANPQGKQWHNPVHAEEVLKAMRLRDDEMYDFHLITPERIIQMHQEGRIGPRQWAKLKNMMQ